MSAGRGVGRARYPEVGQLRDPIVIQRLTRVDDGQGGANPPTWVTFATVWALIEPLSAAQLAFMSELQERVSHRIYVRKDDVTGLTQEMQISYTANGVTRIFQIHGFRDIVERRRFVEIMAEEGAAS